MPVPKRKRSRARRDSRFANKGLEFTTVAQCQTTHEPCLPHAVCPTSGYYKGRKVFQTKQDRRDQRDELKRRAEESKISTAEKAYDAKHEATEETAKKS